MNNGRVLIAGGYSGHGVSGAGEDTAHFPKTLDTAEIFDPVHEQFIPLRARLNHARRSHLAVALGNKVLLFGGLGDWKEKETEPLPVELYDDKTQRFSDVTLPADLGPLWTTATPLGDGTVLLTGSGSNQKGIWTFDGHSFTRKKDRQGRPLDLRLPSPGNLGFRVDDWIVLITLGDASVQCIDVKTWTHQDCANLPSQNHFSAARVTAPGRQTTLFVRGGWRNSGTDETKGETRRSAWRFTRAENKGTWTALPASQFPRDDHMSVPLAAVGKILIVGGVQPDRYSGMSCPWSRIPWVEQYGVEEQRWVTSPRNMMCSHGGGAAVSIRNGRCVLVTGGYDVSYSYVPGDPKFCAKGETRGSMVDAVAVAEMYCAPKEAVRAVH